MAEAKKGGRRARKKIVGEKDKGNLRGVTQWAEIIYQVASSPTPLLPRTFLRKFIALLLAGHFTRFFRKVDFTPFPSLVSLYRPFGPPASVYPPRFSVKELSERFIMAYVSSSWPHPPWQMRPASIVLPRRKKGLGKWWEGALSLTKRFFSFSCFEREVYSGRRHRRRFDHECKSRQMSTRKISNPPTVR